MHAWDPGTARRRSQDGPVQLSDAERGGWGGEGRQREQREHGVVELRDRHHSPRATRDGRRRSSDPSKDDTKEQVIYEGPCGQRTGRFFHRTTFTVTDWSVEVEREGAHPLLTLLTLGIWYWLFQSISTEVFELERVAELQLRGGNVIVGSYGRQWCCGCGWGTFMLDTPERDGGKSTRELFHDLKAAWVIARGDAAEAAKREEQMLLDVPDDCGPDV